MLLVDAVAALRSMDSEPMYSAQKVKEAAFFWGQIKSTKPSAKDYPFYFSAFFSAYRSITFVMQSGYKRVPGFDLVYDQVLKELAKNPLLRDLKEARNIVLKEGAKVPAVISRFENQATGDVMVYECDPFMDSPDIVRSVSVEFGYRQAWLVPSALTEAERISAYTSQLQHVVEGFKNAPIRAAAPLVRVAPDGEAVSLEVLASAVEQSLAFFETILAEFDALTNAAAVESLKV